MSDLVEQIRHVVGCWDDKVLCGLLDEAADEIEWLRNEMEIWRSVKDGLPNTNFSKIKDGGILVAFKIGDKWKYAITDYTIKSGFLNGSFNTTIDGKIHDIEYYKYIKHPEDK